MVSFEIFVKAMLPSLLELKVLPSFCFAFKIPDNVAASNIYIYSVQCFSGSKNCTSSNLAVVQIEKKKPGTLAEGTSKLLLLGFWVGSGIFNFSGGPIQIPKNGSSSLAISIKLWDHSYITSALVGGRRVRKCQFLLILSTKNMLT